MWTYLHSNTILNLICYRNLLGRFEIIKKVTALACYNFFQFSIQCFLNYYSAIMFKDIIWCFKRTIFKRYSFIYFGIFYLVSCNVSNSNYFSGNLNVSPPFYIDLYHLNSGGKVFSDSLNSNDFNISIKNLPKGIYQVVFSWKRDLLKPQDIERFTRQPELGVPKYYLSTTFWLDNGEANEYNLSFDKVYNQDELEEILFNQVADEPTHMWVKSNGLNNKLYCQYLDLLDGFKHKNRHQKDSLQQVENYYIEHKMYDEAKIVSATLHEPWLDLVKNELITQEILFMKKHISSDVIIQIYNFQVNSKQDFERYIKVYNSFPSNIKQVLDRRLRHFME